MEPANDRSRNFQPGATIMDRKELNDWIRLGPIRITMNSGNTVDITNRELVTVSYQDRTAVRR